MRRIQSQRVFEQLAHFAPPGHLFKRHQHHAQDVFVHRALVTDRDGDVQCVLFVRHRIRAPQRESFQRARELETRMLFERLVERL